VEHRMWQISKALTICVRIGRRRNLQEFIDESGTYRLSYMEVKYRWKISVHSVRHKRYIREALSYLKKQFISIVLPEINTLKEATNSIHPHPQPLPRSSPHTVKPSNFQMKEECHCWSTVVKNSITERQFITRLPPPQYVMCTSSFSSYFTSPWSYLQAETLQYSTDL
jgi:hypothetical protein